jgi:DNA-binding protein HU-beta
MSTTTAFEDNPPKFPGWPSRDCKEILQLKESLESTQARLEQALGSRRTLETVEDDADDGLGPYRGFFVDDKQIGVVAFLSYAQAPFTGTEVVVDAETSVNVAIDRLRQLLKLDIDDIKWAYPGSKTAQLMAKKVQRENTAKLASSVVTPMSKVAAELAEKTGMTKKEATVALDDFVGLVVKHLKKGTKVRITGLGILQTRNRPARMGRNPATGEIIKIKASKKIAFRGAKALDESLAGRSKKSARDN